MSDMIQNLFDYLYNFLTYQTNLVDASSASNSVGSYLFMHAEEIFLFSCTNHCDGFLSFQFMGKLIFMKFYFILLRAMLTGERYN